MYCPRDKFGGDTSSGFCFWVHTHIHTHAHVYGADKRPTHAGDYVGVSMRHIFSSTDITKAAVITIAIRLRYDYDTTTTKNWHVHFFCSRRMEAGARDTS